MDRRHPKRTLQFCGSFPVDQLFCHRSERRKRQFRTHRYGAYERFWAGSLDTLESLLRAEDARAAPTKAPTPDVSGDDQ